MTRTYTPEEHKSWMKTLPSRPAGAGIVLLAPDGRAVCLKASYKQYWTFPGGSIDASEHPLQAAIRETREEVGIALEPAAVTFVLTASQLVDQVYSYYFLYEAHISDEQYNLIQKRQEEIDEVSLIDLGTIDDDERLFSKMVKFYANGDRGYVEFEMNLINKS